MIRTTLPLNIRYSGITRRASSNQRDETTFAMRMPVCVQSLSLSITHRSNDCQGTESLTFISSEQKFPIYLRNERRGNKTHLRKLSRKMALIHKIIHIVSKEVIFITIPAIS